MVVIETILASTISGFIMGEVTKANIRTHKRRKQQRREEEERRLGGEDQAKKEEQQQSLEIEQAKKEIVKIEEDLCRALGMDAHEIEMEIERQATESERERVKQIRMRARKLARKRKEEESLYTQAAAIKHETGTKIKEDHDETKENEEVEKHTGIPTRESIEEREKRRQGIDKENGPSIEKSKAEQQIEKIRQASVKATKEHAERQRKFWKRCSNDFEIHRLRNLAKTKLIDEGPASVQRGVVRLVKKVPWKASMPRTHAGTAA